MIFLIKFSERIDPERHRAPGKVNNRNAAAQSEGIKVLSSGCAAYLQQDADVL